MKKLKVLLIFSFILLLFSGNATAALIPGSFAMAPGTWERNSSVDPHTLDAVSNAVSTLPQWSLLGLEVFSVSHSDPFFIAGGFYVNVNETEENGTFEFEFGVDTYSIVGSGMSSWKLYAEWINPSDPNQGWELTHGEEYYGEWTGSIIEDSSIYQIILTAQGDETFRDASVIEGNVTFAQLDITMVPVPATMLLLGSGLIGLAGFRRKKFKK
jgi:hypothetical protein